MYVSKINLEGFRNYKDIFTCFDEGINVIIGNNAQGKTNLLESLYYLSSARSFRTRNDKDLIGFNADRAVINADIFSQSRQQHIKITLHRGRKKEITVNSVKLKKASELSGKVMSVLFCPEDLSLVKSGAAARRRLMDSAICQLRPKYALYLSEFNKLFENKTRILKDFSNKPSLLDTLEEYNIAMAQRSANIVFYRAHFVKKLKESAANIHSDFTGGREELDLEYLTTKTVVNPLNSPSDIFEGIMVRQNELRKAEIDSGMCLVGAHKDDIEIKINGVSARSFASQGQTRTGALSIKMAERDIFCEEMGEPPILLLDDVLSELDAARQDFVLNRIMSGQVFITCCEDMKIASRTGGKILHVDNGEIL